MPGDFESFLNDQQSQATQVPAGALAPPQAAPDSFESFMAKAKGEQDAATLQSANATTVANAQQGSTTATAAAPIARQLGMPQPAVEADLPRFQQQAKVQQNTSLLSANPVLARWVAANPDSARIAQDEYPQLASIEQIFSAGTDSLGGIGYTGLQGLASSFSQAGLGLNRQIAGLLPGPAGEWWQQHMVVPLVGDQAAFRPEEGNGTTPDTIGRKSAGVVANLLGLLSQITLTGGGGGEAAAASASPLQATAEAVQHAVRAMAFPSLTSATNKGAEVFDKTGDRAAAIRASIADYLFTTAQGVVPFSAPGGLAKRAASGALSSVATSEGQRGAMNLLLPDALQQNFDPQEALFQAVTGAALGGVMGPRGEPNYMPAIRQTYVDALKAEQAERDIGKVAALGQIAGNMKLREADPDAFHTFVQTVSDSSKLDAVYIDAKELAGALQQSDVDITSLMPGVKAQIGEGVLAGTDVRIPIADYATHIAGTDLEKALIPNLKAAPDGMTFKDGQAFYQKAVENMQAKADEMAKTQGDQVAQDADKQSVHDNLFGQLQATGRYPDAVARAAATLPAEFYATQAGRMGMTPSELFKQMPLRVVSERIGDAKELGQNEAPAGWGSTGPGGEVNMRPGADSKGLYQPATNTIALLKNADLSTVLHESAHAFLHMTGELTKLPNAPEAMKADYDTLAKWMGAKDGDTFRAMSLEEQRTGHEKFARAFESYLMEGKAPTHALQPIFSRFRSWLVNVYKSLLGLRTTAGQDISITPEVRAVMDRLIASDTAIKETEASRGYLPLFKTAKEAGLSDEEFAKYVGLGEEATSAALDTMQAKSLGDLAYASRAKSKVLRDLQQRADGARKAIREQVEQQVNAMPVFQAADFLGDKAPEFTAAMSKWGSDREAVKAQASSLVESAREKAGDALTAWEKANPRPKAPKKGEQSPELEKYKAERAKQKDELAAGVTDAQARAKKTLTEWEAANKKPTAPRTAHTDWAEQRETERATLLKEERAKAAGDAKGLERGQAIAKNRRSIENEVERRMIEWDKGHPRPAAAEPQLDIAANMHGFSTPEEMLQAIHDAGSKKDVIDGMTDLRMLQEHGELVDPQAVEAAANDAVHNEVRARFMATGLKVLTKSPLPAAQIAKAAMEAATTAIRGKRIMDLNPKVYLAAETKANKDAIAKAATSPREAIEAQRAAVLSNRLAKAAMDAQAAVDKGIKYLRKVGAGDMADRIGSEYQDRINELLSQYDVTNRMASKADIQTRQDMRAWLDSEFARTGIMPEVSDGLLDFTQRRQWKELTVEEFGGLMDAVKSLEHVGRNQTTLTVLGKSIQLADMVARAKAGMADLPHSEPVDLQPHLQHAKGLDKIAAQFLNLKSKVRGLDAALLKMEQLFQWLDHGNRAGMGEATRGPFLEMFQRAGDAEGAERSMRAESSEDLRRLGKSLRDAGVDLNESLQLPLQRPGRGGQWYREELIAAALNTGNAGNLQKLTDGYKWDRATLMQTLDAHLSKAEWQFVQGVWDSIGKYGPHIEALQKRLTGIGPKMVEPVTVQTQHGDFKGGYYPVVYDAFLDKSLEQKYAKDAAGLFENNFAKPATSHGHTVNRTGYVGPLQLSLGVIPRHIDQVTHDLAWREAIIDINKFLSHKELQGEVDQVMGREYTRQFRPWLQGMANDRVFNTAGDSAWESFYRRARTNATMVGLGFRLSTMMIHGGSALSNSIGEVGAHWFAKGAAQFATPERWEAAKQFMYDRSPEMANRFNESERNIREAIEQINEHQRSITAVSAAQKTVDAARRFAFYGVQALDMGSAAPTWYGAYLKGMSPEAKGGHGMSEEEAIGYANRAVRNAHGGGGVKDLAAVQRDKGVLSLATMFYSFWNHMYNRQRDIAKGFGNWPDSVKQGTGTRDFAKLLARSWWYFVIPQMIHAALKPGTQDQDQSLGGHLAHMAEEIGLGFVSGVPVLRDLANAAINGRDYSITPLEQAGKSIVMSATDAYKAATGAETSNHPIKNAAMTAGYVSGLPIGQAATAGPFLWDIYNGNADAQGIKDWYSGVTHGRIEQ